MVNWRFVLKLWVGACCGGSWWKVTWCLRLRVVFTVVHGLWEFNVVVRLVCGNGCVMLLNYLSVLKIS